MSHSSHGFPPLLSAAPASAAIQHIVCIDPGVDNYQHLAAGVMTGADVYILNSQEDGVQHIIQILHNLQSTI